MYSLDDVKPEAWYPRGRGGNAADGDSHSQPHWHSHGGSGGGGSFCGNDHDSFVNMSQQVSVGLLQRLSSL